MSDPVFDSEQEHLSETYTTLVAMEEATYRQIAKTRREAEADKKNMADELASNFASEGEAQETYVEYANMNSVIDAYNQMQASSVDKLSRIGVLKQQPYFAKVVLQYKPGAEPKELYIGNAGISDDSYRRLVVDWRSPVAEVYYNQANGKTSYQANGRTINVDLKLRRQFDIEGDRLNAYFDTTVAIQDEMLLASLSRQRTEKMQAITTTIQKEQNLVIRHEDVPALLVNGVAGSGKTSVMMQRIAYLFYQRRDDLDARQVFLITPNPVFRRYIDNVLPDMGERNPHIWTWDEFAAGLVPPGRDFVDDEVSLDDLRAIDASVGALSLNDKDFRDVKSQGRKLITAQQIARVADKFKNIPAGPRLITLVREELEKRLESRLGQLAGSEEAQDEVAELSHEEQIRIFGEPTIMEDEELARSYTLRYLRTIHEAAFAAVRNDYWLRIDRIGKRLLGKEELPFLEWAYLKIAVTGMGTSDARYVMIDEVQDYTAAQIAVLARYFRRAHFLLLGDENQAIRPHTASFDEVKRVLEHTRGTVSECHLMTSYRSTPAITSLFARLAATPDDMSISSVQRDDVEPVIEACADDESYLQALNAQLDAYAGTPGLTALIAHDEEACSQLSDLLGQRAESIRTIGSGDALPGSGTVLIPLSLAKGLEFDHVIIADASANRFGTDELSRKRLYTAISRATSTVAVLSHGPLAELLS